MTDAVLPILARLDAELAEQVEKHRIPGASMAVLHNGVVHTATAGWADVAEKIPVTVDTMFQVGSSTKTFAAVLMMRLVEAGLVELEAPAVHYLPDLKVAHVRCPETITVRMLLDHSNGIDGDFFKDFGDGDDALRRYVDACADLPFVHAPGAMRSYSNAAYCIAGRIIEVVTEQPFAEAFAERLLGPLGVRRFVIEPRDRAIAKVARGYQWDEATKDWIAPGEQWLPYSMSPTGSSLAMTVADYLLLARLQIDRGITQGGQHYLGDASIVELERAYGPVPPGKTELRIGWGSLPAGERTFIATAGQTTGHNAHLNYLPGSGYAVAIETNMREGGARILMDLGFRMAEACTGVRPSLATQSLTDADMTATSIAGMDVEGLVGVYVKAGTDVRVVRDDDVLRVTATSRTATGETPSEHAVLVPLSDRKFSLAWDKSPSSRVTLEFIADGSKGPGVTHLFLWNMLFRRVDQPGKDSA